MSERPKFEWRLGSKTVRDVFRAEGDDVVRYDTRFEELGIDERAARFVFEDRRSRLMISGGRMKYPPEGVELVEVWLEARPIPGEWTVIESSVEES